MKIIFPVAGYGTRLLKQIYESGQDTDLVKQIKKISKPDIGVAKALIPVCGQPVINHLIKLLIEQGFGLKDIYIVSNNALFDFFNSWAKANDFPLKNLINEGSGSNETRLEGSKAIELAIKQANIAEDVLVIAGDTLFNSSLSKLLEISRTTREDIVAYYQEPTLEAMKQRGAMTFKDGWLVDFTEKPQEPKTQWAFPSIFVLKPQSFPLLEQFNSEHPRMGYGFFLQWLVKEKHPIRGWQISERFDLGTLIDCERANKEFKS